MAYESLRLLVEAWRTQLIAEAENERRARLAVPPTASGHDTLRRVVSALFGHRAIRASDSAEMPCYARCSRSRLSAGLSPACNSVARTVVSQSTVDIGASQS